MRSIVGFAPVILAGVMAFSAVDAQAGVVRVDGVADDDTRYTEYFSNSFIRMDLFDPPPRQTQQRFHDLTDPSITYGSLAYDGFLNDADFRFGTITYDDSVLVGGSGIAPITATNIGIVQDATSSHLNYNRWTGVTTTLSSVVGSVTVVDGIPTEINMTSVLTLAHTTPFTANAVGTFTITGNRFSGSAAFPGALAYDFSGTLTTVPEPTSMAVGGIVSLMALARRRRCVEGATCKC